jgi:hypothetical protein
MPECLSLWREPEKGPQLLEILGGASQRPKTWTRRPDMLCQKSPPTFLIESCLLSVISEVSRDLLINSNPVSHCSGALHVSGLFNAAVVTFWITGWRLGIGLRTQNKNGGGPARKAKPAPGGPFGIGYLGLLAARKPPHQTPLVQPHLIFFLSHPLIHESARLLHPPNCCGHRPDTQRAPEHLGPRRLATTRFAVPCTGSTIAAGGRR